MLHKHKEINLKENMKKRYHLPTINKNSQKNLNTILFKKYSSLKHFIGLGLHSSNSNFNSNSNDNISSSINNKKHFMIPPSSFKTIAIKKQEGIKSNKKCNLNIFQYKCSRKNRCYSKNNILRLDPKMNPKNPNNLKLNPKVFLTINKTKTLQQKINSKINLETKHNSHLPKQKKVLNNSNNIFSQLDLSIGLSKKSGKFVKPSRLSQICYVRKSNNDKKLLFNNYSFKKILSCYNSVLQWPDTSPFY